MTSVPTPTGALVRDVSPRLVDALLTHRDRVPIDVERARAQHAAYCRLLEAWNVEVVRLPPIPEHPDGVFVEDTVVIIDDLAVLTRPGDPSRREEPDTVAPVLRERGYEIARITAPGRLDGGDVLSVGDTLYVGRGSRTDDAGIHDLAVAARTHNRRVVTVPVRGALHLKTAVTVLPDGTLVGVADRLGLAAFGPLEFLEVPKPDGANVLLLGDTVVVPASAPRTAERIGARGFPVEILEIDELEKAEAGLTCLSILLH